MALRLVSSGGLESVSLRRLATELGVTPAAIHWHVRSKEELVNEVVNALFQDFVPPDLAPGAWTERITELFRWLRRKFLDRIHAFRTPDVQHVMTYAFMKIGVCATSILTEAGFEGEHRVRGVSSLMWHAFGFAIFETVLFDSFSREKTPKLVVNRAVGTLPREELAPFLQYVPHMLEFDVDELFAYSLDLLVEGMRRDLERRLAAQRSPGQGA